MADELPPEVRAFAERARAAGHDDAQILEFMRKKRGEQARSVRTPMMRPPEAGPETDVGPDDLISDPMNPEATALLRASEAGVPGAAGAANLSQSMSKVLQPQAAAGFDGLNRMVSLGTYGPITDAMGLDSPQRRQRTEEAAPFGAGVGAGIGLLTPQGAAGRLGAGAVEAVTPAARAIATKLGGSIPGRIAGRTIGGALQGGAAGTAIEGGLAATEGRPVAKSAGYGALGGVAFGGIFGAAGGAHDSITKGDSQTAKDIQLLDKYSAEPALTKPTKGGPEVLARQSVPEERGRVIDESAHDIAESLERRHEAASEAISTEAGAAYERHPGFEGDIRGAKRVVNRGLEETTIAGVDRNLPSEASSRKALDAAKAQIETIEGGRTQGAHGRTKAAKALPREVDPDVYAEAEEAAAELEANIKDGYSDPDVHARAESALRAMNASPRATPPPKATLMELNRMRQDLDAAYRYDAKNHGHVDENVKEAANALRRAIEAVDPHFKQAQRDYSEEIGQIGEVYKAAGQRSASGDPQALVKSLRARLGQVGKQRESAGFGELDTIRDAGYGPEMDRAPLLDAKGRMGFRRDNLAEPVLARVVSPAMRALSEQKEATRGISKMAAAAEEVRRRRIKMQLPDSPELPDVGK